MTQCVMMHCVKRPKGSNTKGSDQEMSTDMSEMTDTVQEVAFGAAEAAAEVASDPAGAVRRQVKTFEKRGTPTARRVNRQINRQVEYATAPARDAFKTVTET